MGTWSVDAFGNDDAADWAAELEEAEDLTPVRAALDEVLAVGKAYLDAVVATHALAAIEAIARLQGHWGVRNSYTAHVDQWVKHTRLPVPAELAAKAHQVVQRILGEKSELKDLWQEGDEFDAWQTSVRELASRVKR